MKNTHGGVLLLVELQTEAVLNCANATKSRKASHISKKKNKSLRSNILNILSFNPLMPGGNKRLYILKQTSSCRFV